MGSLIGCFDSISEIDANINCNIFSSAIFGVYHEKFEIFSDETSAECSVVI